MARLPLTILADKGDDRNIREGANFVKLIVKYNHEEEVDVTCIGISSTGNDSKSAAENIHHTLQLYDSKDQICLLDNQGTDAGGGGTREDLGGKLAEEGRVRDAKEYNIITCTLHALNLCLSSAVELTMGQGSLKKGPPSSASIQLIISLSNTAPRNGAKSGS